MLSRPKLTTTAIASGAAALLLLGMTGCQHPAPPPPNAPPKVTYSETYDREIKEIMDLAGQGRWEDAHARADALYRQDPNNQLLARVHSWVDQQAQTQRSQALEDKIRSIDAKNSGFNPTLKSVLTEQKDRGLPPRKDVRDAIDRIENAPYIPDTYEKTIHEEGPLFDFESEKGRMAKVLEKEVSIHLDNVPLETILVNLSQSSGVNIVADKSLAPLKQVLSINLDNVKLSEFLRYVGRNYDLQFQVGDELVWVVDAKDPKRLMEETRFYRLRKGFVLPAEFGAPETTKTTTTANNATTVTEVQKYQKFVNDLAPNLPSIERAITNLFTGSRFFIDYEHNLVVARGTPEQLAVMENIIKEFDKPIQQVLIEARFITVSKPAFMQLGVLWEADRQSQSAGVQNTSVPQDFTGLINGGNFPNSISASPTAIISGANPALGIGVQHAFTTVFGAKNLSATISALEQSGESQTLSAPRLTVLNNRPASISDGNVQYYYEEYSVASTVQQYYTASSWVPSGKPTKITAGAVLNVLASISGDGKSILLALNPIVNTDVQLVKYATLSQYGVGTNVQSSFDIKLPQYRTEELSTRVAVKSGQTVVMGGVLERQRSTFVESVPVLGDIPLLGALFRRRTESDTPRYLLIFVTATIVKDNGEFLVYDDTASATNSVAPVR
ncbi:MAG TPA: type II secretion system protein GspD [Verrucomicrobiae bacterium]|nr:type II secretion system protein GspD [Verrucomicrobiae bacterium]